jgi:hypothetical protein
VRRVKDANQPADGLFPIWRYHPFFTNSTEGTVNLRSCGRSANHISLIGHARPGESRKRTGENRPRVAQVDSALAASPDVEGVTGRYYEDCAEATPVSEPGTHTGGVAAYALDPYNTDRLWQISNELTP